MEKLIKKYIPMTETAFYILLALDGPKHGYGIIKRVEELTQGRIHLGSGTIYGTLSKMEKDGLISLFADVERKLIYEITPVGKKIIQLEIKRLEELFSNAQLLKEAFLHED